MSEMLPCYCHGDDPVPYCPRHTPLPGEDATSEFQIPDGIAPTVVLQDCDNCASPTPVEDLTAGLCSDCQEATGRALAAALGPAPAEETFATLPIDEATPEEETEQRRARRAQVRAAEQDPQGWLQHAIEAARQECTRGRHGHEFTVDDIAAAMEREQAPMPPETLGFRFVMEEAAQRGWCEPTLRMQPSRRDEMNGRPVRIYRTCL